MPKVQVRGALSSIEAIVGEFAKRLREVSPETVSAIRIFMHSGVFHLSVEAHDPKALKSGGISMRNVRGEWIV